MSEADLINVSNDGEKVVADTRPTKKLLIEGITRDLTVEACIFDLIDNAIDAKKSEDSGLIEITLDGNIFSIQDYASGIEVSEMCGSALRFGAINPHPDGIGAFGVGLNRALFKLGKGILIESETSNERISVNWNVIEYMDNDKWDIPISIIPKKNQTGTLILINNLKDDVAVVFSDSQWIESFFVQVSKRYGYLIKNKDYVIKVNGTLISASVPTIKECTHFKILGKTYIKDEVEIEIKLGRHHLHLFKGENTGVDDINKNLSEDYGWTVYCNDRAILLNDWTHKVGWDKEKHSQYYGFVGVVHLRGEPKLLPWSTSKEDVDLHNNIYVDLLKYMRRYSENWRSFTGKLRTGKITFENSIAAENQGHAQLPLLPDSNLSHQGVATINIGTSGNTQHQSVASSAATQNNQGSANTVNQYNVKAHPNQWDYLFGPNKTSRVQFSIPNTSTKLLAIVNELQKLEIKDFACSIMLLLRVFIEESCKHYCSLHPGVKELEQKNSLAKTVKSIVFYMEKNNILVDPNEIAAINSICSARGEEVISIEYLQNSIHSRSNFLSAELIRPFWRDIHPFIKACYK